MSTIKIACVGDVMCGDQFSCLGWGAASCIDRYGGAFLPDEIRNVFTNHEMVLCNVECVLSDVGRRDWSLRSLHMRGRPQTARYLADWGVTVAHLANNHILEHGIEPARDTADNLSKVGIRTVGATLDDASSPIVAAEQLSIKGVEISVVGACFHTGEYALRPGTLDQTLDVIGAEARQGRTVILSVHWAEEMVDRPSLWQRDAAGRFVEAGAKAVIGHHPHVIQGFEVRDGALIAYSLGNFIFDADSARANWSAILSLTMNADGVVDWAVLPIVQGQDWRPFLADGSKEQALREEISRRNALAAEHPDDPGQYEAIYRNEVRALDRERRRDLYRHLARNWLRYRWIFWPQILLRPVRRRLGIW